MLARGNGKCRETWDKNNKVAFKSDHFLWADAFPESTNVIPVTGIA